MRNKEIIVFYESDKRTWRGMRKIAIKKYIYDSAMKCKKTTLKVVENLQEAEQYCISKGWGNTGYIKDLIAGNVEMLSRNY